MPRRGGSRCRKRGRRTRKRIMHRLTRQARRERAKAGSLAKPEPRQTAPKRSELFD